MPGKSRHGKGKHYSKKSKVLRRQGTAAAMPQATASMPEIPKQATSVATPLVKAAAAPAKTAANLYPYITSELRRIAILAGIIIVILIVLAIVLS